MVYPLDSDVSASTVSFGRLIAIETDGSQDVCPDRRPYGLPNHDGADGHALAYGGSQWL